ncbi:nucleotide sugar dehydrogenase [Curvivirga aplysinae]|uniref:nucleotide sugar dehydrogenase n=1 Tax=Curvivirga aplysinae TaxID=2529852 RepID=UPI0012BBFFA4|nr:nucleotide sugar dehydrogenase [Curvivirga aplysinae]MTI08303.1 UDP-glucose/GDP-mannose dehydrogenase family protein [Curvivirga aplysinae]
MGNHQIGFLGISHLSIVSSICWASFGEKVVAIDPNSYDESLNRGSFPIYEPNLEKTFKDNRENIHFSDDMTRLRACDIVVLAKDSETNDDNVSDMTALESLLDLALPHLEDKTTVVLMSQVPVGFTRRFHKKLQSVLRNKKINLLFWVETLVFGDAVHRSVAPERIILGGDTNKAQGNVHFEAVLKYFNCPVLRMKYESAELTKAAINLYLSTSVTYANTVADLCEATGAQMTEIIPALRLDKRIGQYAYIQPGLGISGGNLERDLSHLSMIGQQYKVDSRLVDHIIDYNSERYKWVRRHMDTFKLLNRKKITCWGVAYKRDTRSIKNSFAVKIMRELYSRNELTAYDPMAELPEDLKLNIKMANSMSESIKHADALIIATNWPEFSSPDWSSLKERLAGKVIFDCVGILDAEKARNHDILVLSPGNNNESET